MTKISAVSFARYPAFLAHAGICIFLSFSNMVFGQAVKTLDSLQQLQEVVVQGYISQQPLLQAPASIGIVNSAQLGHYSGQSLLAPLNLVPGVRMEERSPGSYRLSIRGSLLRSPFGVRNVKTYLDEFPLTDASGNTYLNLIDPKAIERMEILKGPDGSLFGANSGGVVLMDLKGRKRDSSEISLGLNGGSYGLFHENASVKVASGRSRFSFNQAFQRSNGYRQNSAFQRHFLQAAEIWTYGNNNTVKLLSFYSDLQYKTPGGLTQAQYDADPQQARPAAGPNPGAAEQKAGVYNQTFFAGITNDLHLSEHLHWVASVFGTQTDFENPFITNYEVRNEKNLGTRSYLELTGHGNSKLKWKGIFGLEGQKGWHDISNYQNNSGTPGSQLAQDDLRIDQVFYFTRLAATFGKRLTTEVAISLNTYKYAYAGQTLEGKRKFDKQWMPRFATSYLIAPGFTLRATLSRGYSPPTLAEIRPSNNVINTDLQPESGWNREAGFRLSVWKSRLQADVSVFRYDLTDAIVRRVDQNGTEFFVNAGGTKQTGVESLITAWLTAPRNTGAIRAMQITGSYTYSHFLFSNYRDATTNYSGNSLTGVPQTVMVWGIRLQFPQQVSLFIESNFTSKLPLNDGNMIYAKNYHLLQAKISWSRLLVKKVGIEIYVGLDNMLNEKYSLGNDINAFGGRYFNAAAPLNYYAGVNFNFR
ncbi:MAG: TonB-dependent receptor [Saprospiraceae bacterium]|nr:TonB-dependent receptor [Saprospiraceae bacterium]